MEVSSVSRVSHQPSVLAYITQAPRNVFLVPAHIKNLSNFCSIFKDNTLIIMQEVLWILVDTNSWSPHFPIHVFVIINYFILTIKALSP